MTINIFKLYPAWTCWNWIIFSLVCGTWFGVLEYMGLRRFHGAIPYTWAIRDSIPQLARWMIACWILYHFGVTTNTGQPLK